MMASFSHSMTRRRRQAAAVVLLLAVVVLGPTPLTGRGTAQQNVRLNKVIEALENGSVEWAPPPMPDSMAEIARRHREQSEDIIRRWEALPEERWNGTLTFFGRERPAAPMAWSFLFDIVHHRGQISTYLRPMGSTVPQIYGPSGDEP